MYIPKIVWYTFRTGFTTHFTNSFIQTIIRSVKIFFKKQWIYLTIYEKTHENNIQLIFEIRIYIHFATVHCNNQFSTDNRTEDDQFRWNYFLLWCVVILSLVVLLLLLFTSRSLSLFTIFTFLWMEIVLSVYESVVVSHLTRIESRCACI